MKFCIALFFLHIAPASAADPPKPEPKLYCEKAPNTSRFPFPTQLPVFKNQSAEGFDWKAYMEAATSPADKAFRASISGQGSLLEILGGGESTFDVMHRHDLAAAEYKQKSDLLEAKLRQKVAKKPEVLKLLEEFIASSQETMKKQVTLIVGSWGGSGFKAAYAEARARAQVNYYHNLLELKTSFHFQDLPD